MKIRLQPLMVFFTIALLAVSAARAQSIYSSPATFVTIAGKAGNPGAANGTNGAAQFYWPEGIAVDTRSNLYVVDGFENTIRKLTPAGTNWAVTTIAGTPGTSSGDKDGTNGAAVFDNPVGIAVDTNGILYVGENNGCTIRKITPVGTNWVVTTIAGQPESYLTGRSWADGTGTNALFNGPQNLTVDANGNLYVADSYNSVIRKVARVGTNWVVTTIAGQPGISGYADGTNGTASFYLPYGLALDGAGNLYVSDNVLGYGGNTIRKMTPAGTNWAVVTIAGSPTASGSADGMNSAALFNSPLSIAVDSVGNLYVADSVNYTIRKVTPSGPNWVVSTIAGVAGVHGSTDGTGTNALFYEPWGATLDKAGNLFVTDTLNATVRQSLVAPPPPVAAFSGAATNGVAPLAVTFTNLSSNATNYVWNFGDGNTLSTGSNTNVTEIYTNAGTYTVILTAYGPGGLGALTNTAYIVVTSAQSPPPPNPTIRYVSNTLVVSWPNTGNFTLQTNGDLTTPHWANYGGPVASSNGTNSVTIPYPPGSPPLYFRLTAGSGLTVPNVGIGFALSRVVVSWPATGSFTLQTNANLTTANWGDYGGAVTASNGTDSVAFTPAPGSLFFRLRQ